MTGRSYFVLCAVVALEPPNAFAAGDGHLRAYRRRLVQSCSGVAEHRSREVPFTAGLLPTHAPVSGDPFDGLSPTRRSGGPRREHVLSAVEEDCGPAIAPTAKGNRHTRPDRPRVRGGGGACLCRHAHCDPSGTASFGSGSSGPEPSGPESSGRDPRSVGAASGVASTFSPKWSHGASLRSWRTPR